MTGIVKQSAISRQPTALSCQLSAISYQLSASDLILLRYVLFYLSIDAIGKENNESAICKNPLKIFWKQTSESRILKTGYVHDHDHAHVHVDDHVLVIVVVDVNVIVVVDGFVSQPSHWNRVRHE